MELIVYCLFIFCEQSKFKHLWFINIEEFINNNDLLRAV